MDPISLTFLATLLGAFLGVAGPLAISARIEARNYRHALDAAFVQCEGYTQSVAALGGYVLNSLRQEPNRFRKLAPLLISQNFEVPEGVTPFLAGPYAKFVRPGNLFLLIQAEQNLRRLVRNLQTAAEADLGSLDNALDALREHAARLAWVVYNMSQETPTEFNIDSYNTLISILNSTKDRRISSVRKLPGQGNARIL